MDTLVAKLGELATHWDEEADQMAVGHLDPEGRTSGQRPPMTGAANQLHGCADQLRALFKECGVGAWL